MEDNMNRSIRSSILWTVNLVLDRAYEKAKQLAGKDESSDLPLQLHEVSTNYMGAFLGPSKVRYVVSFIVGYDEGLEDVHSPQEAAEAALELTRDASSSSTHWYVHDRKTGKSYNLPQEDFDKSEKNAGAALDQLCKQHTHLAFEETKKAMLAMALEVVELAKATWGDVSSKLLYPVQLQDDPLSKVYRTAWSLLSFEDPEGLDKILHSAEQASEDRVKSLETLGKDLEKLVPDPKDPLDPLATLEEEEPKGDVLAARAVAALLEQDPPEGVSILMPPKIEALLNFSEVLRAAQAAGDPDVSKHIDKIADGLRYHIFEKQLASNPSEGLFILSWKGLKLAEEVNKKGLPRLAEVFVEYLDR